MCVLANIVIMVRSKSVEDVIQDFICVELVSQMDNIIYYMLSIYEKEEMQKLCVQRSRMKRTDNEIWNKFIAFGTD